VTLEPLDQQHLKVLTGITTSVTDIEAATKNCHYQTSLTHPKNHGYPHATFDYLFGKDVVG
jgi:hypothetical protein